MGERKDESLRVQFDPQVRLDFGGSKISTEAGLVAYRELDWKLGLTAAAGQFLSEQRTGRHTQHGLVPLLRQSLHSRLAGYPDTNDADRLTRDPALRLVVSRRPRRGRPSTSALRPAGGIWSSPALPWLPTTAACCRPTRCSSWGPVQEECWRRTRRPSLTS